MGQENSTMSRRTKINGVTYRYDRTGQSMERFCWRPRNRTQNSTNPRLAHCKTVSLSVMFKPVTRHQWSAINGPSIEEIINPRHCPADLHYLGIFLCRLALNGRYHSTSLPSCLAITFSITCFALAMIFVTCLCQWATVWIVQLSSPFAWSYSYHVTARIRSI